MNWFDLLHLKTSERPEVQTVGRTEVAASRLHVYLHICK